MHSEKNGDNTGAGVSSSIINVAIIINRVEEHGLRLEAHLEILFN
jgi:hypothetical protein